MDSLPYGWSLSGASIFASRILCLSSASVTQIVSPSDTRVTRPTTRLGATFRRVSPAFAAIAAKTVTIKMANLLSIGDSHSRCKYAKSPKI